MGVPLIAGCLILAMIAGMALTMVAANRYFTQITGHEHASTGSVTGTPGSSMTRPSPGHGQASADHSATSPGSDRASRTAPSPVASGPSASGPPASGPAVPGQTRPSQATQAQAAPGQATRGRGAPGQAASVRLPDKTILVAGKPVALRTLTSAALLLVPASCQCANAISRLLSQAEPAGITLYLIGKRGSVGQLAALAHAARAGSAVLAIDSENALFAAHRPVGLTLLLVNSRGTVVVVPRLHASFRL